MKRLDPLKIFFYQSDVDEFMKHKGELADAARSGDVSFAYSIFRTFLDRVDERVKTAEELLAAPQDFTVDEQMAVDRDTARIPATRRKPASVAQRVKYDLLVLKATPRKTTLSGRQAIRRRAAISPMPIAAGGQG